MTHDAVTCWQKQVAAYRVMMNVDRLNAVELSVFMLNVVAPQN
jgi:hypothetical protein